MYELADLDNIFQVLHTKTQYLHQSKINLLILQVLHIKTQYLHQSKINLLKFYREKQNLIKYDRIPIWLVL
jgi:sulfate adenylyltransferase subunit 1 (EFTu-like GTPase family)